MESGRLSAPVASLGLVCVLLLCGVLYAGLKPFSAPANQVTWIKNHDAIRFGGHGTMLSTASFPPSASGERSIEIWARPGVTDDSNTLLAFDGPTHSGQVSICQADSDLQIRLTPSRAWQRGPSRRMNVDNAFRDGRYAFWALTFSPGGVSVYRDGKLLRRAPLQPPNIALSGRLVVANSPIFNDSWSGVLGGLAVYDAALKASQIARHYSTWSEDKRPALGPEDLCVALYLFNEGSGRLVHNRVLAGNDLDIPEKYTVLRQTTLDPVWRAFTWSRGFWKDLAINITGLIPLGFFFCAFLDARRFHKPALVATLLGAAVSLFIELTQTALPTRDSSMADVIDNVIGSALGAAAYRGALAEAIRKRLSFRFYQ